MFGQMYNVFAAKNLKVKKEDQDSFKESMHAIAKLQGIIQNVENHEEENKDKFRKDLNLLIPKLETKMNELFDKAKDPKFFWTVIIWINSEIFLGSLTLWKGIKRSMKREKRSTMDTKRYL